MTEELSGIRKWKASKKKVHWWAQSVTESNSHNNEHVPHHSQNVEEQKHNKKDFLFIWILCEAQEDKVSHIVPWFQLLFYEYWFQILEIVHLKNKEKIFESIISLIFSFLIQILKCLWRIYLHHMTCHRN